MNVFSDKSFLADQYQNTANLNARIALHVRFSENTYGWFAWIYDQLTLAEKSSILELGCGSGELWRGNQDRLPPGLELILSDFSAGMAVQARRNLAQLHQGCHIAVVDAQAIPFKDNRFSAIIANHMLYHVPDRERAFAEIRRVLCPGGCFYATTIGERHLVEINELVWQVDPELAAEFYWGSNGFTLENGAGELARWFSAVQLVCYPDRLLVTEAAPLADYILSSVKSSADYQRRESLIAFIQSRLDDTGVIEITKNSGMFIASKS